MRLFRRKATTPKPIAPRDDLWRAIEREIYEFREKTCLWGETEGITERLADLARRATANHGHSNDCVHRDQLDAVQADYEELLTAIRKLADERT